MMILIILQALALIGLVCSILMFWKMPMLSVTDQMSDLPKLSIIIPARNEELRLPPLLKSLNEQHFQHFEVLVVDDGSTDQTAQVATSFGATVLKSELLENMQPGKANACAYGARFATGEWLLFLDADIQFMQKDSLQTILNGFQKQGGKGIFSMQPYHFIHKMYENLSVIFNVTMITGMNVFTFWRTKFKTAGSFGPCIVCDVESYRKTGGHEVAAHTIMDDFALSDVFLKEQLPVTNHLGKDILKMRMHEEGPKQLVEGWTKNLATASQSTHLFVMLCIQLWIMGSFMALAALIGSFIVQQPVVIVSSVILYVVYGLRVYRLARKVGNFHWLLIVAYPLFISFFIAIFSYSFYRTHVLHTVMWRGRKVKV